jgi:hypothetical protein
MTNKTYSTTYNPLGNVTITGGGYVSTNAIYVGGGAGGGTGLTSPTWHTNTGVTDRNFNSLQVKGDAEFQGNITVKGIRVKGRDLSDWLETVDSRLGLLNIDPELESEFDELRALGDAYREAERRFIEQKRVYEILKNTDE